MGAQGQPFVVPDQFAGEHKLFGLQVGSDLFKVVLDAVKSTQTKLSFISNNKSSISVTDMFEMQLLMNHLSQLCEMCTNVVAASNGASMSMIRNFKQ